MERRAVIAEDCRVAATRNLAYTYLQLGLATPESGIWEEEGFRACLGAFKLPICNFALDLRLNPWSAARLHTLAECRPGFHIYSMPGDEPEHVGELLRRAEFQQVYELSAMIADGKSSDAPALKFATDPITRGQVATFMTNQFFARQDATFRDQVYQATNGALKLDLCYLMERNRPCAAIMLARTEGMLGIYNLCVTASRRNRGLGRSIVNWCLSLAMQEKRSVTLQCDPRLQGWYASQGFNSFGQIKVFALTRPLAVDIMNTKAVL